MGNLAISESILRDSIFIIGTVSSVEGRKVKIQVKKDKNLSHLSYKGRVIKNVSVGSYVKIAKGFVEIIGKVEGEYVTKEKNSNGLYSKDELKISRFLDVSLFGHFEKRRFKQGIKEMPLIDNECYLLDRDEFNRLHRFFKSTDVTIKIGTLTEEPSQIIDLGVSKLFASHIGIFGNTGSGKSNTLAKIYTELFRVGLASFNRNSFFVLIDFNGEYSKQDVITPNKRIFNLSTNRSSNDRYVITQSNFERLEVISVLLEATEKTQKPFINRALKNDYLDESFEQRSRESLYGIVVDILQKGDSGLNVNIFTELFNHLKQLDVDNDSQGIIDGILFRLERGELKYHSNSLTYYTTQGQSTYYANSVLNEIIRIIFPKIEEIVINSGNLNRIKFKILSQYYYEIINGYSNQEHIRPLIGRMFKKFEMLERIVSIQGNETARHNYNLEIINLKEVNLEMKKTLPLLISKQHYDQQKDSNDFENRSLHIIIDEAHNILSTVSERESETWKDYRLETFEEIVKEGRKFGTFLTLASQRPYDISPTIISQLHNYFIHRLINNHDIQAIEKTIAYLDRLSFESIPVLSVGSCFIAGLASDIPVKVDIDLLPENQQPKSATINLDKIWSAE